MSGADLDRVEARLRGINSVAAVRRAQRAAVPTAYVLGVGGFDLERVEEDIMGGRAAAAEGHEAHGHGHDEHEHAHGGHECGAGCTHESHKAEAHGHEAHGHSHSHHHGHVHDDAVTSVSITVDGDLDLDKVNTWLGGLIEIKSEDLYRMKGVLAIDGFDRRFVFQGVHMLFEGMPDREWKAGEERRSKMVFIGRDLEEGVIREGFEQCIVRRRE